MASNEEKAEYVPPSGWTSEEEEEVDPVLLKEYNRQLSESDCFDLDLSIPSLDYQPYDLTNENLDDRVGIYGRVGLHWYNLQKGSNLQLVRLVKYVKTSRVFSGDYYITMEVMDPINDSLLTFQTCVVEYYHCKKGDFQIVTQVCRIKPKSESSEVDSWSWSEELVNDFHDGKLEWLPDYALAQYGESQNQYYEVQESEILENDWLNLYTDFAYNTKRGKKDLPLKIKKVVVQTHEDVEPSKKLSSGNAIFYITFNVLGDTEDYKAVVSRITDGSLGHVALEVRVVNMEHPPAEEILVISRESLDLYAQILTFIPADVLNSIFETNPTSGIQVLQCKNSNYACWRVGQCIPDSLKHIDWMHITVPLKDEGHCPKDNVKILTLTEALVMLETQPIVAEMAKFTPDVELYEGIYRGPLFESSEFKDVQSVSAFGVGEENGEAFFKVKYSDGTTVGEDEYIKVSIETMIVQVPTDNNVSDAMFAKPRPIITNFAVML